MILKKIFISVFTFAFVMLFVSKAFANENNDSEKTLTERSHDLNPNDYPIIDIYADNYSTVYPFRMIVNNSAVMRGKFDPIDFLIGEPKTVTDDGVYSNPYLVFNIYNEIGLHINELSACGVNTIGLDFKINLWEVNDGYQRIYLKDGSGNDLSNYLEINHTAGSDPKIYDIYAEIGLNQLTSEIIYFQFDASGAGSDDWKFSSIVVDFYVSREYKVNNYINNMGIVESLYV